MKNYSLLFLFTCIFFSSGLTQTTLILTPEKDNTLYESPTGDLSNGSGAYLFVGRTNQTEGERLRRALLKFNIGDTIPEGSTIMSVSLTMSMTKSGTGPSTVNLHRMIADWGEGGSNSDEDMGGGGGSAAQAGDATWTVPFFDSTLTWTNAGGDYEANSSGSTSVNSVDNYTWTDSLMAVDVQLWLDSADSNFGWIVIGDESAQSAKRFDSRENETEANRPMLEITYTEATAIRPELAAPLRIYPNPVSDLLRIELPELGSGNMQVMDMQGRIIMENELNQPINNISTSDFAPGFYWVKLIQNGKLYGAKFERR